MDSFKDQKFNGLVTEIANSANNNDTIGGRQLRPPAPTRPNSRSKSASRRRSAFLPGMSVTANIETRYRTNVLSVPIQSVTTRLPTTNSARPTPTAIAASQTPAPTLPPTHRRRHQHRRRRHQCHRSQKKPDEPPKPIEVVFVVEGDHVKMVPVKRGISDDNYVEILEGLKEGAGSRFRRLQGDQPRFGGRQESDRQHRRPPARTRRPRPIDPENAP